MIALGATLLLSSLLAPAAPVHAARSSEGPPNVILFLVDDLGWADVGCYGDPFHRTPAIDRLADEGLLFTDAYAASPVCSSSRASLMTGKSPARIHITDWIPGRRYPKAALLVPDFDQELSLAETTLAEVLRERGYATWHVGKWHLGNEPFWPLEQGFDVNVGGHAKGMPGSYHYPYEKRTAQTDWSVLNMPPGGAEGDYLTDALTEAALGLLDRHAEAASGRPFFLHMSYYSVHTPVEGRPDLVQSYRERKGEREAWSGRNAGYAAMVHSVDASVGRIMGRLDALGLGERTLVLFTSDNGGYIGLANMGGLREGKGFLYEGGIRVPLIARWPGRIEPGGRTAVPATGPDLFATVAGASGAEVEPHDGVSLLPLFDDPRAGASSALDGRDLFWHYPHYHTPQRPPSGVVRRGRYKLIEWYEDGRRELYDLREDPGERADLATARPELTARLGGALQDWLDTVDAQRARPNPDFDPEAPFAGGHTPFDAVTQRPAPERR